MDIYQTNPYGCGKRVLVGCPFGITVFLLLLCFFKAATHNGIIQKTHYIQFRLQPTFVTNSESVTWLSPEDSDRPVIQPDLQNIEESPYLHGEIPYSAPGYLNPSNPYHRTGRKASETRALDTGTNQLDRWKAHTTLNCTIPRGNWSQPDDIFKDLLHSVDWENANAKTSENFFFQRNTQEAGWGAQEHVENQYWDCQCVGATQTYPRTIPVGLKFNWSINWLPWLKKKYSRQMGQPIKSFLFNMGGVEPLQIWFWPDGTKSSRTDFCSVKLVTPPGWNLPYSIYMKINSEHGEVSLNSTVHESKTYVDYSLNFCRLLTRKSQTKFSAKDRSLMIGPAGNINVSVGIANSSWEWDDGVWAFEQWIKDQSAMTKDEGKSMMPDWFVESEWYQNYKYRDVPDKHFLKYMPSRMRTANNNTWNRQPF